MEIKVELNPTRSYGFTVTLPETIYDSRKRRAFFDRELINRCTLGRHTEPIRGTFYWMKPTCLFVELLTELSEESATAQVANIISEIVKKALELQLTSV